MTYQQLISEAMVKLAENDRLGAEASYLAAIAAAQQVDPQGPRHAEALNYLAQFLHSQDRMDEAANATEKARAMLEQMPELAPRLIRPELQRRLDIALEYEGWHEADAVYQEIFASLDPACSKIVRARLLTDHAQVSRRAGLEGQAFALEAQAQALLGGPLAPSRVAPSSVDLLRSSSPSRPNTMLLKLAAVAFVLGLTLAILRGLFLE